MASRQEHAGSGAGGVSRSVNRTTQSQRGQRVAFPQTLAASLSSKGLNPKSMRVQSSHGTKRRSIMALINGQNENVHPNILYGAASAKNIPVQTGGDMNKSLLSKKPKLPAYMQSLNQKEKEDNFKIIENMNKKISYRKNPRFRVNKAPILFTMSGEEGQNNKKCPFRMEPKVVQFTNYQINGIYEVPLRIINNSETLQRVKIAPPESPNFTIREVTYPSQVTGDIAPGLCATAFIVFMAPSFADFDDYVTVITETNAYKVPIRAKRDPPVISLQNPMNCLHAWVGDRVDMAFRCQNTGGDGGFRFFCEKDEDDAKQTEPNSIKIGAFSVTPSQFYLYSGNAIDVYVSFSPDKEGYTSENLILACDNNTSESFSVCGIGAMLDVEVVEVDGRDIDFKANPFNSLHFPNTNPTSFSQRTLKIKNASPILVPYHWSIFKNKNSDKISIEDDHTHYKIEPSQGKIQAGQTQSFVIIFSPEHAEPYFEFSDFIIEDLPIQCVRDPPEGLKQFAEAAQAVRHLHVNQRFPMPQYVGSNTQFMSVPLVEFSLVGQGNSCQVRIDQPVLNFEGDLFINSQYKRTVKLRKQYRGTVYYKLELQGKSSQSFFIDLTAQGKSLQTHSNLIESEIKHEDEIELEVTIQSSQVGYQSAFFFIEIADGAPLSFEVQANFRGPIVRVIEPIVDFGLVKVNTFQKFRLSIENASPIKSEILIKSTRNTKLTFETLEQLKEHSRFRETKTLQGNVLKFADSPHIVIPPNQRVDLLLQLQCKKTELFDEYFEIIEKQSNEAQMFFQVIADIQKPLVMLNKLAINLGNIYAGVPENINKDKGERWLTLRNYGNIPAQFQWEETVDQERMITRFEPLRGIILPKSEIKINVQFTVFYGGVVDELLICNIEDVEIPLGVEISAESLGLSVAYETAEPQVPLSKVKRDGTSSHSVLNSLEQTTIDIQDQSMISNKAGGALNASLNHSMSKSNTTLMVAPHHHKPHCTLKMFNFQTCTINKVSYQKFLLKNLSGIRTKFSFCSRKFEPLSHQPPGKKPQILHEDSASTRTKQGGAQFQSETESYGSKAMIGMDGAGRQSTKLIRFAPSTKSGSLNNYGTNPRSISSATGANRREKPILSDEHEETQKFSSKTGESHTQTKRLQQEASHFLANNKGIAIVFNPQIGELPPHSEIPITVSIYNNVCGRFDDQIISEIKGLMPVEFPISIAIKGSPVEIPSGQVGLNYNTVPPTLPMPTQVVGNAPIQKHIKVKNTGIRAVEIQWQVFDQFDFTQSENDFFNVSVVKNLSYDKNENPYKFNFEFIEPEESHDSIFDLQPKQTVMGPKEVQDFLITFSPNKEGKGPGKYKSIVLATPALTQEEFLIADDAEDFLKKGSLGIVSFNLYAQSIVPILTVDKKKRIDGFYHMNFKCWSYRGDGDAPSSIYKVTYTNETKSDLVFNLLTEGPFEITKVKTNTNAKHPNAPPAIGFTHDISKHGKETVQTYFNLQPLKILEVSLKCKLPSPQNHHEWPLTIKNHKHGELKALFNNGDCQQLLLDALLLRPMLMLLTEKPQKNDYAMDELDFGTLHVDSHRTVRVFLSNVTEVTAKWRLNYVSFPKKSNFGYMTKTAWESENLEKTDDPDVFEFSVTEGSLKGKTLPLRQIPEGLCVPPVPKDQNERQYLPQTILINFRPKKDLLYKSKFRFIVENGISCDIILKGRGSYEENYM